MLRGRWVAADLGCIFDERRRELRQREFERKRAVVTGALVAFD